MEWLRTVKGLPIVRRKFHDHYDIWCNGHRIEVKYARPQRYKGIIQWRFNIHRHGKLKNENADFYLLRFLRLPGMRSTCATLVIPSPLPKMLNVSIRQLIGNESYGKYFNDFSALSKPGPWPKPESEYGPNRRSK